MAEASRQPLHPLTQLVWLTFWTHRDRRHMASAFEYLLNQMDAAAQSENPAAEGYGPKRKAVIEYVAALRQKIEGQDGLLASYRTGGRRDPGKHIDRIHAADAKLATLEARTRPDSPESARQWYMCPDANKDLPPDSRRELDEFAAHLRAHPKGSDADGCRFCATRAAARQAAFTAEEHPR